MADVVTTVGKNQTMALVNGATPPANFYIGWGTGAGTAAVGDTALFTAAPEARVQATKSVANSTETLVGTITAGTAETITEAGAFDASTAGNLWLHSNFTGIALAVGDSIQFTFNYSIN
jgi:hypothetical protein